MKEIYCPKCTKTFTQGSFCPHDGTKLLTRVTAKVEFRPIKTERNAEIIKRDAKQWLQRIGVSEIVFSSMNNAVSVSYVLQGKTYKFTSHMQDSITNNLAAVEQFLHHRVLGIERGIETSEQAFAGYVQLADMSSDYFAACKTLSDAEQLYRQLSKQLHPDRNNGRNEEFVRMAEQFEDWKRVKQ